MTSARFAPAFPITDFLHIYALDGTATGIGNVTYKGGTVSSQNSTILSNRIINSEVTDV